VKDMKVSSRLIVFVLLAIALLLAARNLFWLAAINNATMDAMAILAGLVAIPVLITLSILLRGLLP